MRFNILILLSILLFFYASSWSQILPPLPPEPPPPPPTPVISDSLVKPVSVTPTKVDTTMLLIKIISDTLKSFGFDIVKLDDKKQLLMAKKQDNKKLKDHDKVLIWLEREFKEPYKSLKIYLIHARYK